MQPRARVHSSDGDDGDDGDGGDDDDDRVSASYSKSSINANTWIMIAIVI